MDSNLAYNSSKEDLILPEFGRNVQKMVQFATKIEDPKMRQGFAERIVKLMLQMQPSYKNTNEYWEKMWNQLFMIAEYKLDVTPPENITIIKHSEDVRPKALAYPNDDSYYRHYGRHIQLLVDKAVEMEDGPQRNQFLNIIASYMKLAYRTWNPDHYVNDENIKRDLKKLSKGVLDVPEDFKIDYLKFTNIPTKQSTSSNKRRHGKGGRNSNQRDNKNKGRSFKNRRGK